MDKINEENRVETINMSKMAKEQIVAGRKKIKDALAAKEAKRIRNIKRVIALTATTLMSVAVASYWFAKHYYIQSPITFDTRPMVVKLGATTKTGYLEEVVVQETLTDIETVEQYRFAPILKGVYMLESTWGQNDSCKQSGGFNGYGYRQNERENKCYESFGRVTELVNDWYEERLATNGNNLAEALCYYNTGIAGQASCKYFQDFISILVDNL